MQSIWKGMSHPLQFHFFRRSPQMKYLLYFLSVLFIAIFSQIVIVLIKERSSLIVALVVKGGAPTPYH